MRTTIFAKPYVKTTMPGAGPGIVQLIFIGG
jgi:hypothetical protein